MGRYIDEYQKTRVQELSHVSSKGKLSMQTRTTYEEEAHQPIINLNALQHEDGIDPYVMLDQAQYRGATRR